MGGSPDIEAAAAADGAVVEAAEAARAAAMAARLVCGSCWLTAADGADTGAATADAAAGDAAGEFEEFWFS